ncbi:hypothetical protein TRIP_C90274 [Candidatus Zixiibacteriota bacterium]|nr:hypothetical protein TRIP_C90274 [candidate division Zixibacteria bacterium]
MGINRFFDFSSAQLKVVIFLTGLLLILSFYSFIKGFSEAGTEGINLSVNVGDGDLRYQTVFRVDPNFSPADSLDLIPGIGPVLSRRIVAYRDSVGHFEKVEDLLKVRGISRKLLEKIGPYFEIRPW